MLSVSKIEKRREERGWEKRGGRGWDGRGGEGEGGEGRQETIDRGDKFENQ